jgi:peptide deformylase
VVATYGESDYNEGCLSYMGVYLSLKRPERIEVKFQNASGEWQERIYTGLTARIFLHEYDHMQGKTMKDQVSPLKWALAVKKGKKKQRVA